MQSSERGNPMSQQGRIVQQKLSGSGIYDKGQSYSPLDQSKVSI